MLFSLEQSKNTLEPVCDSGVVPRYVIVVNDVHELNALPPIELTVDGIVTDVRVLHPLKARSPIDFTLYGML